MIPKSGKITPITIAALCVGFLLGILLLPVFTVLCLTSELQLRGGVAPDADFDMRRAWGEHTYGEYLDYIDPWISKSPMVCADIGPVERIAPIGGPNTYQPGFTDGSLARMKLEIVGKNGSGVLTLPHVEVSSTGQIQSIGDDANWSFAGSSDLIHKSGRSYLKIHGLESIYSQLMQIGSDREYRHYFKQWANLKIALSNTNLPPTQTLRDEPPPPISRLHDRYREPLLEQYGDALAHGSNDDEAIDAYLCAAKSVLKRAEEQLEQLEQLGTDAQDDTVHSRIETDLRFANRILRKGHELDSKNRSLLKLARDRAVFQYFHSIGGRPSAPYTDDDGEMKRWAETSFGFFYEEAVKYPERSPYLQRTLGRWRMRVDALRQSRLYINQDNMFAAYIHLKLSGRTKKGRLTVRIKENAKHCQPIDLFADEVRAPDYPITIVSPYWDVQGEEEVKLSAKTGEPK